MNIIPSANMRGLIFSAILCASSAAPPAQPRTAAELARDPNLHSVLWMQTAAEYRAQALQTYRGALRLLEPALADPGWRAFDAASSGPLSPDAAPRPAAVILDLDETALDNSPYQAWLIKSGGEYREQTWKKWCATRQAGAIPGAVEFTRAAHDKGVKVFYVSNRTADVEVATRENMLQLGFPLPEDEDVVLLKGEREGWGSAKGARFAAVAAKYRVIMMFGDNLGDFSDAAKSGVAVREQVVRDNADKWGAQWFMLPNPAYGSWESALFEHDYGKSQELREELKTGALRAWDGSGE